MKRNLIIIIVNLLVLLILLVVIDPFLSQKKLDDVKVYRHLGLREFGPNRHLEVVPDTNTIDISLLDHQSYTIETNNSGYIIGPNQDKDAHCDILFFGGSTTECAYVDDSLRFPYLVGKKLNVSTGNAGYGGNHSFHSFINLLGKGLIEKPKTVVWMHAINDFSLLSKTGDYFVSPQNRRVLFENTQDTKPTFGQRWNKAFASVVLAVVPNLYGRVKKMGKSNGKPVDEWEGYRDLPAVHDSVIQQKFKASLESFVATAKSHHINVVLMTQFNRIYLENREIMKTLGGGSHYTDEHFIALYHQLNQIIRDVATQKKVLCIDLESMVPNSPEYFYDAVHLNNAGSKVVSEIIVNAFQENGKK